RRRCRIKARTPQSSALLPRGWTLVGTSFRCRGPIALPGADLTVAVDVHLDAPPCVVATGVGRRIPEQILIGELVEELAERIVELVDAVREERAATCRRRQPLHNLPEPLSRHAASLADHVQRHVARSQAPPDVAAASM